MVGREQLRAQPPVVGALALDLAPERTRMVHVPQVRKLVADHVSTRSGGAFTRRHARRTSRRVLQLPQRVRAGEMRTFGCARPAAWASACARAPSTSPATARYQRTTA